MQSLEKVNSEKKTIEKLPTDKVVEKSSEAFIKNEGKTKSEIRAERRAKQEAQRAAKKKSIEKSKPVITETIPVKPKEILNQKASIKKPIKQENSHVVNFFKHLCHERFETPPLNDSIHPAIVKLGVQYENKVIVGSNARCVGFLAAVKKLIKDFVRPAQADFARGLDKCLEESAIHLDQCRPLAVSVQNALRYLKWQLTKLSPSISDTDAKAVLDTAIDTYISQQIELAMKAISINIQTKISDGDVILTYGFSSLINTIFVDAYNAGKKFHVVVVDGRQRLEGKEQLRRLVKHGIECSYILMNALDLIMPQVSKVFLAAHAILGNGSIMSRGGTSQVALMAKACNVPVLVACETHKYYERALTNSITYNELGNPDEFVKFLPDTKKDILNKLRNKKNFNILNIIYDVTPSDFITGVVTEMGISPCKSVPAIMRNKPFYI
ncbi:translation initiation factor eIF2B subunit delta [Prorops nasuta]|uniref:translation initiation factor eIF2B subunit delta n=1 Tax=Prorops nasuta TaxID=863751 RepID=UPI0034CD9A1F